MKFFKAFCQYEWHASPLWECLPELEQFCCCIPLKFGVFIIGMLGLVQTGVAFALLFPRVGWDCDLVSEWVQIIGYFSVPAAIIAVTSSISVLCLGCRSAKCNVTAATDIFIWVVILTHTFAVVILISIGLRGMTDGCPFPYLWLGLFLGSCIVWSYFICVVNSYRKYLDV